MKIKNYIFEKKIVKSIKIEAKTYNFLQIFAIDI